jgi:hypothetical protein
MLPLRLLTASSQSTASHKSGGSAGQHGFLNWRRRTYHFETASRKTPEPFPGPSKRGAGKDLGAGRRSKTIESVERSAAQAKALWIKRIKNKLKSATSVGVMDARHERQQGQRLLASPDGPGQSGTPLLERGPDASNCLNRQARHWPERTLRTLRRWQHLERVLSPPRHEASRRALTLADYLAVCRARALVAGFFL